MAERTLVLIKPDAMQRRLAGEILARFERRGLDVRAAKLVLVDEALAGEHYAEHREKPFFGELVEFITSSPTLALVLEGESRDPGRAHDDGRDEPGRLRARARSAAISRSRCRTTSSTARTRPSRRSARSRSGSPTASLSDLSDHARRNRAEWTSWAPEYAEEAPRAWAAEEITWGVWGVPETEVQVLPESVEGLDVVELGCGTAYISAWLARRGARPVGVDVTPAQLETARQMQRRFGLEFPLLEAERRGRAAAGRELRPGRLRVRGVALG